MYWYFGLACIGGLSFIIHMLTDHFISFLMPCHNLSFITLYGLFLLHLSTRLHYCKWIRWQWWLNPYNQTYTIYWGIIAAVKPLHIWSILGNLSSNAYFFIFYPPITSNSSHMLVKSLSFSWDLLGNSWHLISSTGDIASATRTTTTTSDSQSYLQRDPNFSPRQLRTKDCFA